MLPRESGRRGPRRLRHSFNGHPPLGVNATTTRARQSGRGRAETFQRAPTLGGECYMLNELFRSLAVDIIMFQRAPTLGGECYEVPMVRFQDFTRVRFNGHPPLGVNATVPPDEPCAILVFPDVSTGTHPWG